MKLARLMYDSSLMADDRPYEVLIDGSATGVVELPVEWTMDDFPYFGMDRQTSLRLIPRPTRYSPSGARNSIRLIEGTMFILTMHPHVIGHRSRVAMLERLVQHMITPGSMVRYA